MSHRCEICNYPGGAMQPCTHAACEDCSIDGECYECFVRHNAETPVVIAHAGLGGGFTCLWSTEGGQIEEENFCRQIAAYVWAGYVLTGILVNNWRDALRVLQMGGKGKHRGAMRELRRAAAFQAAKTRTLEAAAPGMEAWANSECVEGMGAMLSVVRERADVKVMKALGGVK